MQQPNRSAPSEQFPEDEPRYRTKSPVIVSNQAVCELIGVLRHKLIPTMQSQGVAGGSWWGKDTRPSLLDSIQTHKRLSVKLLFKCRFL